DDRQQLQDTLNALIPRVGQELEVLQKRLAAKTVIFGDLQSVSDTDHEGTTNNKEIRAYIEQLYGEEVAKQTSLNDIIVANNDSFWFQIDALNSMNRLSFVPEDFEVERIDADRKFTELVRKLMYVTIKKEG